MFFGLVEDKSDNRFFGNLSMLELMRLFMVFLWIGLASPVTAGLLDVDSNAKAAYSLRRLLSSYSGPAIQVRRTSDNQIQDIYFTAGGDLDTATLASFVGSSNGEVTRWYSQLSGHPPMVPPGSMLAPLIVENGQLILDTAGLPRLKFFREDALRVEDPGLPVNIDDANVTVHLVIENEDIPHDSYAVAFQIMEYGWQGDSLTLHGSDSYTLRHPGTGFGDSFQHKIDIIRTLATIAIAPTSAQLYQNHALVVGGSVTATSHVDNYFIIGSRARNYIGSWTGYISELIIYDYIGDINIIRTHTDEINSYWKTGPTNYHPDALLPQKYDYQIVLYDWLETISVADVTLPAGTLTWDGYYPDVDTLADIWLSFVPYKAATLSRVTRQLSKWLVLDDGSGSGIEATGEVRLLHTNESGHKSWGNEPAYWYALSLPLSGGGNGNPYYHNRALANRALVVSAIDMLMYDAEMATGSSSTWNDMHGKGLLSWVQAVYACKNEISTDVLAAFETGFKRNLELSIETGVRDANTNMDMFPVEAAAIIAKRSQNSELKTIALRAAKRLLLGYEDGKIFTHHDPNEGAFFPAGYIGENDMAEGFYNGESFYHITGAWSQVYTMPDWAWLGEVLRRMSEWRIYQAFPDPAFTGESGSIIDKPRYDGPSGYSARTSANALSGQASVSWRDITAADMVMDARPLMKELNHNRWLIPDNADAMVQDINQTIDSLQANWGVIDTTDASLWSWWSPWPKSYPYLPPHGWYSRLDALKNDSSTTLPIDRVNLNYSKAFGAEPTGMEFWSYRAQAGERDFGWYVEADAQQGTYGGWYGGKLELFWSRSTGIIIINRHGKSGCDAADNEDSTCWDKIDTWGAHHMWGKDENGRAFSPVHLKGRSLSRTSVFNSESSPVSAQVTNIFNDGSNSKSGEETGDVIEGHVAINNQFEALENGITITHALVSDGTDDITALWATIPVFLGDGKSNIGQPDTTIEKWTGHEWQPLNTTLSSTTLIRLGRDFLTGQGPQYVYLNFDHARDVKLAASVYQDPYQTDTRIRNIHVDLHGFNGKVIKMPRTNIINYSLTMDIIPGQKLIPMNDNSSVTLRFYPHPSDTYANIEIKTNRTGKLSVEFYNMVGEMISKISDEKLDTSDKLMQWQCGAISTGLYIALVKINNQVVAKKKIVVRH